MKKKVISALFAVLFCLTLIPITSAQVNDDMDYKSFRERDGLCLFSICTSLSGSGCNAPGSIHQIGFCGST